MNTFRAITRIVFITATFLLIVGCTATAVSPDEVVEVPPTNTPEPTNTATAVHSPTFTPQPTATATTPPTNTPTSEPSPTAIATKQPTLSEPFNIDYLVNASQLNLLTEDIGIIEWEAEGADVEWEYRLCRSFLGVSWSISPNVAINCIFKSAPNTNMDKTVEWLFENEILYVSAFPLEPSLVYDTEYVLYADQYDNGQSVFDGFFRGDGVLYWASISVGTPGGYTPQMVFDEYGAEIEALLHKIFMINLGQSESEDGSQSDWANSQLVSSQNSYEAGEFEEAFILLQKGVEADPETALKTFEDQVLADPESGFAYFGRGVAQLDLQNMEEAFADLSQAILLAGSDPMAQYYYLMRGFISYNQFDFENAINDWEQAATINPNNADVLYNLGLAYRELGAFETAVTTLQSALSQDIPPEYRVDLADLLTELAEELAYSSENRSQAAKAVAALQAVLAEIPESDIPASRLNNICWYTSLWGLAEDALFACELAVDMEPENGSRRDSRGLARALTGDFEGAIEDFQYFITWGPDNQKTAEEIALRKEWIEALETGDNPFTEALLADLRAD